MDRGIGRARVRPMPIHHAERYSQVWVTTHSETLARGVAQASRCAPMYLVKQEGATRVEGGPEDDSEDLQDEERE